MLVQEGMRSSLTCPLIVQGRPVGFMYFTHDQPGAYATAHVEFFQQIAGQLALIVEKGRLYSELATRTEIIAAQNRQMRQELETARTLQRALIPARPPAFPGLDVAFTYEPATVIGGDVLDLIEIPYRGVLFFVGDAMGHGVQAALLMAVVKTALHGAIAVADCAPAAVLGRVNRNLMNLLEGRLVTAACGLLDPTSRRLDLALAGHPRPWLVSARDRGAEAVGAAALPLGFDPAAAYPEVSLRLEAGDTLVVYTDGLVETENATDAMYGPERPVGLLGEHAREPVRVILERLRADLEAHRSHAPRADDLTILMLQTCGRPS
jgi:serine phosphatase RsbU (regulator of sigma subunit)